MIPYACYFCGEQARIQPGNNSYLVDCEHCEVSYEIDYTALTTPLKHPERVLEYVRAQRRAGRERPTVTQQQVKT